MNQNQDEASLVAQIIENQSTGQVARAALRTDDRVLARITDGIYRQPSSALRELISNAYDADATNVIIQTDAPRFNQIIIRDDGNGMNITALARLIHHIGGSSKRTAEGAETGTTNSADPSLSPKGRRLIGKIGIGLFSVAQLTRHFQIVTKVKGNDYRLIAEVVLHTYAEDEISDNPNVKRNAAGEVAIRSVPADDLESHGTEITLLDLKRQTVDLLSSQEVWNEDDARKEAGNRTANVPSFHIGRYDKISEKIVESPRVPWSRKESPADRFRLLFQAIINEIGSVAATPKLESSLDNYFKMVWTLSLAAPVNYIESHPFDLSNRNDLSIYQLKPAQKGQAEILHLDEGSTVRQRLGFKSPERGYGSEEFRVFLDDIELLRPIRFSGLPKTTHSIKHPLLFVGSASPDLSQIAREERGGDLEFEAYFLWAPKIVPKENAGLLIRIGDASGTLFDETFAKYQVSEATRLGQITAEIYVRKGLDAALNIDRESFNYSHPHYQIIMRWVHGALRQIVNTLKGIGTGIREENVVIQSTKKQRELEALVVQEVARITEDKDSRPAEIELTVGNKSTLEEARAEGKIALNAAKVLHGTLPRGKVAKADAEIFKKQIIAVAQILNAYGVMADMTYQKQEELLHAIVAIFNVTRNK